MKTLFEYATEIHKLNRNWWIDLETGEYQPEKRDFDNLANLFASEIMEMFEALRKNKQSEKIPGFSGETEEIADLIIRLFDALGSIIATVPENHRMDDDFEYFIKESRADVYENISKDKFIRILLVVCSDTELPRHKTILYLLHAACGYCVKYDIPIIPAIHAKLEYNKTRTDHTLEHRRSENGKKF